KCGEFDIGLVEALSKGKAVKGGKLGVFLPHDENGRPLLPGPDRICIVVEGLKDAASLHGLDFHAVGLPTNRPVNGLTEIFRDCYMILVPDRDEPSVEGFTDLEKRLRGVARGAVLVELPLPFGEGGDVRDLLKTDNGEAILRKILTEAGAKLNATKPKPKVRRETGYKLTDLGNAQRLVEQHGEDLHFCHPWGKWLGWDKKRWAIDQTGEVERRAKATIRSMYAEAAGEADGATRKLLVSHATRSESAARLAAMVKLAESEPGIPVLPGELDGDPWAFNCLNGTIDLRTGRLRPHRREDMITKLAPVEYPGEGDAECPVWESFLDAIFCGRLPLISFVWRLCGYALTGSVRDHILGILYGRGSNGKSTFVEALLAMLGEDYGLKAPGDFLTIKRDAHPTALADLFGKRLVVSVETEDGRRLAESQVKELTGADTLRARRMREDFWQFQPTHKLLLATNHKPEVRGTDLGIWRRLRLIPFDRTFTPDEQDKELAEKLRGELPHILRWCVQGCLDWQQRGLGEPEEVAEATASYRDEQDVVGQFIVERCVVDQEARVRAGDLYAAYEKHAEAAREFVLSQRKFGDRMTERGYERKRSGGLWYTGIGLVLEPWNDQEPKSGFTA
ncbi:MAG: DNA primase, partial [Planctomycetes bacterium]|nr:DNA primase [Planctomycetota bacterium]